MAAAYKINNDISVGLKWIWKGGELYLDGTPNPGISNHRSFHPTFMYKRLWLQTKISTDFVTDYGDIRSRMFATEARWGINEAMTQYVTLKIQTQRNTDEGYSNDTRQNNIWWQVPDLLFYWKSLFLKI